ncbi:DegQ family serine endoprotease [Lysobacter sp. H21R4]|uniref:DegQ family serine endoprotease n=1 Tax=Lysobacter sp. H21R4 TaxID=2781021 RepID=UPI001887ACC2|nr:DegQ family serine endoprotease [Lysobacter sp. H21R4]QOY62134.1 DegQ family serine endoprotease [Lysobacter sp. H21R4]
MPHPLRSIVLLGALAATLPLACTAQQSPVPAPTAVPVAAQAVTPPAATPIVTGLPDFSQLVKQVGPAVVNISAETTPRRTRGGGPQLPDGFEELFRHFGMPMPGAPGGAGPQRGGTSLGSGFVISDDGYVLTNFHVIDGADKVTVTLSDRREFEAEVVGSDEQYDVAVLKIKADGLRWLRAGRSTSVEPGQWVVAIGSPFGLDHSVTAGIVSAVGRSNPYSGQQYVPFIQTDVAINRGNSGGPLLNTSGEVVGINSQIFSNSGGFMGVSFAIPIDLAMSAVEQIKTTGKVSRGMLGVNLQPMTSETARAIGLPDNQGAMVANVQPGSAAEKAGIERMDVIRSFNGIAIKDVSDLPPIVGALAPGSKAQLEVFRNGKLRSINVVIGGDESAAAATPRNSSPGAPAKQVPGSNALGLTGRDLAPAQRRQMGLGDDEGVLLAQVESDAAREAGLRPGDVVVAVGRDSVGSPAELDRRLSTAKPGDTVMLLVQRGGSSQFIAVTVPKR